jgi:hypothetical protein
MGHCFVVTAREYSSGLVRPHGVLQRESDTGPGLSGGATADGIDYHHHGAAAGGEYTVHFFGGARFFDAETRQVLAHGNEKSFRVCHTLNVAEAGPGENAVAGRLGFVPRAGDAICSGCTLDDSIQLGERGKAGVRDV